MTEDIKIEEHKDWLDIQKELDRKAKNISIDIVSPLGLSETSMLLASTGAWEEVFDVLNQRAEDLLKTNVSEKRGLAIELKTVAEVLKIKTGLGNVEG